MPAYRVYCLDGAGNIRLADPLDASGETEAVAQAREMHRGTLKCEVWQGNKLVATLDADDLAD